MSQNIACHVVGCTEPIIGQCTGYQKNCGRFYCRGHAVGTLCSECAGRKAADERAKVIYEDYSRTAKELQDRQRSAVPDRPIWVAVLIGIPLGLAVGFALGVLSESLDLGVVYIKPALCMGPLIGAQILGAIAGISVYSRRAAWLRTEARQLALQIERDNRPGFTKFFDTWLSDKRKESLTLALKVAGAVAVVGLAAAAAATTESDYDRTRRAVREELDRRGS